MRHTTKRDANEVPIVEALMLAGAKVARLTGTGEPDLLVEYRGALHLLEVKDRAKPTRVAKRRNHVPGLPPSLTDAQVKWWCAWRGRAPAVVHDPAEALAAIGARP